MSSKEMQLSLLAETRHIMQADAFIRIIKTALRRIVEASGLSREQFVDAMNAISIAAGRRLTSGRAVSIHKDTLDKWLNADEAEHIPGLFALHVASLVAKDAGPLYAWLTALGEDVEVLTPEDRLYLEYGKKMMRKKIHAEEAAEAEKQLRRKLK